MQPCFLAVDIGASSGRHIVGTVQDGKISLQEVYRARASATPWLTARSAPRVCANRWSVTTV